MHFDSLAPHKGLLKAELQSSLRVGNLLIWCEKLKRLLFQTVSQPSSRQKSALFGTVVA
jgi:hypothetical protein